MLYSADDFKNLFDGYFFSDVDFPLSENEISAQRQVCIESLCVFIEEHVDSLSVHLPKLIELTHILFPDKAKEDASTMVMCLMDEILSSTNEDSSGNPFYIVRLFSTDEHLCNSLKNRYTSRLIEKIRFADQQRKSLRNPYAFNRHIAKVLTEMTNTIRILFELGTSYEEMEPILQQYYELSGHVNTTKAWTEFFSLRGNAIFDQFIQKNNIDKSTLIDEIGD